MMAIEMVGGVYCPLSPRDPQQRLHALVQQTHSRLVLVHHQTKTKVNKNTVSVNIDSVISDNSSEWVINVDELFNVGVTSEHIAYIIFTSGSTGTPKAVN